jgi:hypothetical protein
VIPPVTLTVGLQTRQPAVLPIPAFVQAAGVTFPEPVKQLNPAVS